MAIRMVVEIADEDWSDPNKGIHETMGHLCGLVGIADEDWGDPVFQELWKKMVQEEVPRVVKIEEARKLVACPPRYTRRRPRQL